jgi:hypothetical protein
MTSTRPAGRLISMAKPVGLSWEHWTVLGAIANFTFIPHQPVWSIVMIAIAVTVVWALTAHGRDIVE